MVRRQELDDEFPDESPGFSLADYLQLACNVRRSVRLTAYRAGRPLGEVIVNEGEVWRAWDVEGEGAGALKRLALAADVEVAGFTEPPGKRTILEPWQRLVLEAVVERDESERELLEASAGGAVTLRVRKKPNANPKTSGEPVLTLRGKLPAATDTAAGVAVPPPTPLATLTKSSSHASSSSSSGEHLKAPTAVGAEFETDVEEGLSVPAPASVSGLNGEDDRETQVFLSPRADSAVAWNASGMEVGDDAGLVTKRVEDWPAEPSDSGSEPDEASPVVNAVPVGTMPTAEAPTTAFDAADHAEADSSESVRTSLDPAPQTGPPGVVAQSPRRALSGKLGVAVGLAAILWLALPPMRSQSGADPTSPTTAARATAPDAPSLAHRAQSGPASTGPSSVPNASTSSSSPALTSALPHEPAASSGTSAAVNDALRTSGTGQVGEFGGSDSPLRSVPVGSATVEISTPSEPPPGDVEHAVQVRILAFSAVGLVDGSAFRVDVQSTVREFAACHKDAAQRAGRPSFGRVYVTASTDWEGKLSNLAASGSRVPGVNGCVSKVAARIVDRNGPYDRRMRVRWTVDFRP